MAIRRLQLRLDFEFDAISRQRYNVTIELFDDVGAFLCKMATIKRQYDQNCCQPTAVIALTTVGCAVEWYTL